MNINKRRYITESVKDKRETVIESVRKMLKEAEDDLDDDLDSELDGDMDSDLDDNLDSELDDDMDSDLDDEVELSKTQKEQVEEWADELLATNIETEIDDEEMLGGDSDLDDLDGERYLVNDNIPLDADDLQSIIDNDDSLEILQNELEGVALEIDEDEDLDGLDDESDEIFEDEDEDDEDLDELDEAINYLEEAISLRGGRTNNAKFDKVMENEFKKIRKQVKFDVKNPDDRNQEVLDITHKKFAEIKKQNQTKLQESKLVLENYALTKVNNLLVVAGDLLTSSARLSIVENFSKCKSKIQIDEAYKKLSEKIKLSVGKKKSNINESIDKIKTNNVKVLKESKENKGEKVDLEMERKKHLMGFKTKIDVYNK